MIRAVKGIAGVLLVITLFSACSKSEPWKLKDISNVMPDLQFTMTDQSGRLVHGKDFRGQVVLLYFGYTHCPDVCPTTLTTLAQAVRSLGADAKAVRVLFVTVDPKRDTQALMKQYVRAFGPEFVGLRGDQQQLEELTRRYRVKYGLGKPDAEGNYEVSHSSAVYVFDREGHVRLLSMEADSATSISHDLQRLVAGA